MEKHTVVFLFTTLVFLTMPWTVWCCLGLGRVCKEDSDCCVMNCHHGICRRPCSTEGKMCHSENDCCSRFCDKSRCRCRQSGRECTYVSQCCSHICKDSYCGSRLQPSYSSQMVDFKDI